MSYIKTYNYGTFSNRSSNAIKFFPPLSLLCIAKVRKNTLKNNQTYFLLKKTDNFRDIKTECVRFAKIIAATKVQNTLHFNNQVTALHFRIFKVRVESHILLHRSCKRGKISFLFLIVYFSFFVFDTNHNSQKKIIQNQQCYINNNSN